jgi:hypothetical protein
MMTFLLNNLAALPKHRNRTEHLLLHARLTSLGESKSLPEGYSIYESNAGDLSLMYNEAYAIHSLDGALEEAYAITEEEVKHARYSINIILGIGLGYVLQATIQKLRKMNSQARVIVLERDLELLRFTLSNVNLEDVLNYEHLYLFTEKESLWNFVECNMVKGDGAGIMITPGTLQAFSKDISPITEKLILHTENALRNIDLMQVRSKLWTNEFLKNLEYLPNAGNSERFENTLTGKTALLCAAGPSLNDVLPHIKPVRSKLVIFAVTGAVKALQTHGITPDFVIGMDYYGPAKHMQDMEEPLKECHVITGPSAEHFMFSQPSKSQWIACLKYNEQYSYMMDEMFNTPLSRYHSGGTVAYFMLLIVFQMGVANVILAGQDLALRGTQIYATGESHEVQGEMLVSKELDNRTISLKEVQGWNGETLLTQEDYRHFKYHYDGAGERLRNERPGFEIYNCSVGGALINGMENLTIESLLPRLNLKEDVNIDQLIASLNEEEYASQAVHVRAKRLHSSIKNLLNETIEITDTMEEAMSYLKQLKLLKATSWGEASKKYSDAFNRFSEQLEENGFMRDTFYHEQLTIYQNYNEEASTEEEHRQNFKVDELYLNIMMAFLKKTLKPELENILSRMTAKFDLPEAVEVATP